MRKTLDQLLADVRARKEAEEREIARRYRARRRLGFVEGEGPREQRFPLDRDFG